MRSQDQIAQNGVISRETIQDWRSYCKCTVYWPLEHSKECSIKPQEFQQKSKSIDSLNEVMAFNLQDLSTAVSGRIFWTSLINKGTIIQKQLNNNNFIWYLQVLLSIQSTHYISGLSFLVAFHFPQLSSLLFQWLLMIETWQPWFSHWEVESWFWFNTH